MRVGARASDPPLGRGLRGRGEELRPAASPTRMAGARVSLPGNRCLAGGGQERLGLVAGWTGWTTVYAEDRDKGGRGSLLLPDVGAPGLAAAMPCPHGVHSATSHGKPSLLLGCLREGRHGTRPAPGPKGTPPYKGSPRPGGPCALEVTEATGLRGLWQWGSPGRQGSPGEWRSLSAGELQ